MKTFLATLLALLFALATVRLARADAGDEDARGGAREAFVEGTALVEEARWSEALESFERAARLMPHPITSYNVAACHRALGAYTQARLRYREALALADTSGSADPLDPAVRTEIEALLGQLDGAIARFDVTIAPAPALVSVDGRPLLFVGERLAIAGARPPGPAEPVPVGAFVIELNPGVHTVTVQRDGHADVVRTIPTKPGSRTDVVLQLDRLPSTMRIASTPPESVVRIDGIDVGTSPLVVTRPPGIHRVVIVRPGYVTYETQVATHPGEDLRITGNLAPQTTPITKKWWFWTAIGATVAAAAVVSYAVVKSSEEPAQAPFDGGSLGWTVPPAVRF